MPYPYQTFPIPSGHRQTSVREYLFEGALVVILGKIWSYSNPSPRTQSSNDCELHQYPLYDQ
jgi:hypothetical protein